MDEATARVFLSQAVAFDRDLGALLETIATIPDEALRVPTDVSATEPCPLHEGHRATSAALMSVGALRRRLERAVGGIMGMIARDLIFPVERLHPARRPAP